MPIATISHFFYIAAMKALLPQSYPELLERLESYYRYSKPGVGELMHHMGFRTDSFKAQAPVFFIRDYSQGKYVFIDPSYKEILGYEAEDLTKAGPFFFASWFHPSDFKIFSEKAFPETIKFLKKQHPDDRLKFSSSLNYRIKTQNGKYLSVLQRSTYYLHPDTGQPLAVVGFVSDITHYKDDTKIIHTIEKIDWATSVLSRDPVYKAVYYPEPENRLFSKREMEILQLMCQGLTSKEIAKKLFVSINTINNHRKNILQKSNCRNVSELVNYALKSGLAG